MEYAEVCTSKALASGEKKSHKLFSWQKEKNCYEKSSGRDAMVAERGGGLYACSGNKM